MWPIVRRMQSFAVKHVIVAIVAVVLFACSGHGSSKSVPGQKKNNPGNTNLTTTTLSAAAIAANKQARRDVAITSCAPNAAQHVEIKGTVRNASSSGSDFVIQLSISDKTGVVRYATSASAYKVAPTRTAQWDAATTAKYEKGMTCKVSSVSRTASK